MSKRYNDGQPTIWVMALTCFGLILWLALTDEAQAQTAECRALNTRLASLNGSYSSKQYRASARKQNALIRQTQSKMNRYSCSSRKRYFIAEAHPSCKSLRSSLKSMKRNLVSLQSRAIGRGKRAVANERRRVKRALRVAGCKPKSNKLIAQLFGSSTAKSRRKLARRDRKELNALLNRRVRSSSSRRLRGSGVIQTMCVRTCDGYAFPVSYSTGRNSLNRSSRGCNILCPGRKMKLYYKRKNNDANDDMVSAVDGSPYSKLPTAGAFRKTYNPSCACNFRLLTRTKQTMGKLTQSETLAQRDRGNTLQIKTIIKPVWRVNTDNSETTSTSASLQPTKRTSTGERQLPNTDRKIRIVGDAFLPGQ